MLVSLSGCHSSANRDSKLILFILAVALWLCQIFQTLQENHVTFQNTHRASHSTSAFFAGGATVCFSSALLAIVLMHVLRPDYTPVNHMISDYAVGRFGWIMTTAFVALACGILMLLAGLARCGPASALARVGMFFLGVPCIGLIVTAIYPTDLEEARSATRSGNIHTISFLVNVVSILLAVALLSASFRSHTAWRNHQRTAIALASLVVLAFIFQFLTLHRGAPYGIANRLFVSLLFAWLLTTSIHLLKVARQ
jgi:Protein of unknown function (DUF998)